MLCATQVALLVVVHRRVSAPGGETHCCQAIHQDARNDRTEAVHHGSGSNSSNTLSFRTFFTVVALGLASRLSQLKLQPQTLAPDQVPSHFLVAMEVV